VSKYDLSLSDGSEPDIMKESWTQLRMLCTIAGGGVGAADSPTM